MKRFQNMKRKHARAKCGSWESTHFPERISIFTRLYMPLVYSAQAFDATIETIRVVECCIRELVTPHTNAGIRSSSCLTIALPCLQRALSVSSEGG